MILDDPIMMVAAAGTTQGFPGPPTNNPALLVEGSQTIGRDQRWRLLGLRFWYSNDACLAAAVGAGHDIIYDLVDDEEGLFHRTYSWIPLYDAAVETQIARLQGWSSPWIDTKPGVVRSKRGSALYLRVKGGPWALQLGYIGVDVLAQVQRD